MMRAIRLGGPVALAKQIPQPVLVPVPKPAAGEALVKNVVHGVNMLDTYHRKGLYPMPPAGFGSEGAGIVVQAGSPADAPKWVGRRVAYFYGGALAEYTCVPVARLMEIPRELSYEQGLVLQIQGLTAHYLTTSLYQVKPGDSVLVHASGSGTGNLCAQICSKVFKANTVGTCSTGKVAHAKSTLGPQATVIDYSSFLESSPAGKSEFVAKLRAATPGGGGFHVVYDGVGKKSFEASLESLRPRGLLCLFGNSSGPVPPVDPLLLSQKGSLFLTRPTLVNYSGPDELPKRHADLKEWISKGLLSIHVDTVSFPFEQAGEAQHLVEVGQAIGKVVVRISSSGGADARL